MRLDRFVSSQCPGVSRSEVKKLVKGRKITVNGVTAESGDMKVSPDDDVRVEDKPVVYREHIYIMMNKPGGVVCSTKKESGGAPCVIDLVPPELRRKGLFPAGRLDKDTEGFVLITDDGELAHRMLSPAKHVPKKYIVRLRDPVSPDTAVLFEQGVTIPPVSESGEAEKCRPAQLDVSADDPCSCTLTICEGKFHQVKRMFDSVGNKVIYLKRLSIGNLGLAEHLEKGECLEIMHKDVEKLLTV